MRPTLLRSCLFRFAVEPPSDFSPQRTKSKSGSARAESLSASAAAKLAATQIVEAQANSATGEGQAALSKAGGGPASWH